MHVCGRRRLDTSRPSRTTLSSAGVGRGRGRGRAPRTARVSDVPFWRRSLAVSVCLAAVGISRGRSECSYAGEWESHAPQHTDALQRTRVADSRMETRSREETETARSDRLAGPASKQASTQPGQLPRWFVLLCTQTTSEATRCRQGWHRLPWPSALISGSRGRRGSGALPGEQRRPAGRDEDEQADRLLPSRALVAALGLGAGGPGCWFERTAKRPFLPCRFSSRKTWVVCSPLFSTTCRGDWYPPRREIYTVACRTGRARRSPEDPGRPPASQVHDLQSRGHEEAPQTKSWERVKRVARPLVHGLCCCAAGARAGKSRKSLVDFSTMLIHHQDNLSVAPP